MGELVQLQGGRAWPKQPWIGKPDLARRLDVSTRTIDRWVEDGMPEYECWRYVGKRRKYRELAVLEWLSADA